ncbi:MAG: D-alanyl-D-alanine carboxypeptidase [Clostridia bacterium]|nr:D-alanyl-D-alanine carboxypeptidase [Clostridia bacterium]
MKKKLIALILIFLLTFSVPASAYQISGFDLHCEAAMLISLDTGDVLFSKNADKKMYPASLAKIMSAIVMIENVTDLENEEIPYTESANNKILGTGSVVLGLKIGEKMKAKDALYALLISSCGDVAYAISEYVGGTTEEFVDKMNSKAAELGLTGTHFTNPVGLHDDDLYSTANDIAIMTQYALKYDIFKKIISSNSYKLSATNMAKERTIISTNMLITPSSSAYYQYATGGKTGFTDEAGRCLMSTAQYEGYNYLAVVLKAKTINGTRNEFIDSANLFRWAFRGFEYKTVLDSTTPVVEAPVELSFETDFVSLCLEGGLNALLPKDADSSTIKIEPKLAKESFDAPIKQGDVMGTADIYYAEEKIGTLNLVASKSVKRSGILVFLRVAKRLFTSPVMIVVYVIVGVAALLFIAMTIKLNSNKKRRRKIKYKPMNKN